jgi:sugar O-acyltransferase (sialic acid O-acetyltransferase NeuD family)
MQPVIVPTTDVNSETAIIVEWRVPDGGTVRHGEVVAEVETSKSVIEVEAPADGLIVHGAREGAEVSLDAPIAQIAASEDEVEAWRASEATKAEEAAAAQGDYRATRGAQELAERHGIDLAALDKKGLITSRDVETAIAAEQTVDVSSLPPPLDGEQGRRRVLLIGGGLGATQVLDILCHDREQSVVGIVDDDRERWGDDVAGVPVVGGTDRLEDLFVGGTYDAAIITISTSVPARSRLRELCAKLDIPLTNAIDPTARLATDVELGSGNVICAFCHLGVGTVVGDNNFLSAYNSFDHHSTIGHDSSTGPGCMTSGLVTIGDRVRLGTGIFVEPKVSLGHDVVVASGSVIVTSVPDNHVVKARSGRNVVSPRRR